MHPGVNGKKFPEKPAGIMAGSGNVVTHGQLNELSNQGAHLFRSLGLKPGDSIAIMMENHHLFFPIVFAAWRSGPRYTTISWRLQPAEVEYIVKDCGAKVFITSKFLEETANNLENALISIFLKSLNLDKKLSKLSLILFGKRLSLKKFKPKKLLLKRKRKTKITEIYV